MFNSYNPYIYNAPRSFNFSNLLNNASKTLNVINQALPIYREMKPLFKNAGTLLKVARGLNSINNKETIPVNNMNNVNQNYTDNSPKFFI